MSSNTCAASDSILHAEPNGSTTSNCIETMKCTLDHAIAIADPSHHVIQLDDGTYSIADTMNLTLIGIHLVPTAGAAPKVAVTNGKTVFNITADAELDGIEIAAASSTAIACSNNANVVLEQIYEHGSQADGFDANTCTLLIERSRFYSNQQSGLYAHSSAVTLRNSFFYGNGNNNYQQAAVTFDGSTTGKLEFNTLSVQRRLRPVRVRSVQAQVRRTESRRRARLQSRPEQCRESDRQICSSKTSRTRIPSLSTTATSRRVPGTSRRTIWSASPRTRCSSARPTSISPRATPTGEGKVRDDTSADCSDTPTDFDGDTRPQNNACDYGADELKTP